METWWPQLRQGDLVGYLTDDEMARLLAVTETAEVAEGDPILSKGSPSRSLILVEDGEVEIVDPALGESVALATVGPGGVVGEVGFVDGQPRTHDVRARSACRLKRVTRERLLELVKDDPVLFAKLALALAELLADRFRRAVGELEPVRAFAASLGEPMDADPQPEGGAGEAAAGFDEIDEPLPESALELIKAVARSSRKGVAGV